MELGGIKLKNLKTKRILAIIIDQLILSWCCGGIGTIAMKYKLSDTPAFSEAFDMRNLVKIVTVIFLCIMILKDIFKGASIGKRIFKLYVGNATQPIQPVKKYKLILRNITVLIWPIEAFLLLKNGKRIGDYITNTTVYSQESNVN